MTPPESTGKPESHEKEESSDYHNSPEWQLLSEDKKSILSRNFTQKVEYNKTRHTIQELVDTAGKLGIDTKHDDIPGLSDSGMVLLVYRIQRSFNSDAWYLNDGLFGPLTEKEVSKRLSGQEIGTQSGEVAKGLSDSAPEMSAKNPDTPQNPDIILSLGNGGWRRNDERAYIALSLARHYPSARLLASGGVASRAFASKSTTQAAEQKKIWEIAGLPNPILDPETTSSTTAENISNSWPKIVEVGENKKNIELTIVTDDAGHAGGAKRSLLRRYAAYIRRFGRKFNLKVTICLRMVTEKPVIAATPPKAPTDGSKTIERYDRQCRREATSELPYRYVRRHIRNGTLDFDVQNGGFPGYRAPSGKETNYRMSEVTNLIRQGTRAFVSVHGVSEMSAALSRAAAATGKKLIKINKNNLDNLQDAINQAKTGNSIIHLQWSLNVSSLTANNRRIVKAVASLFNNGISTYIHCQHGAHRGPAIVAMAGLESGLVTNFEDAVDFAGIEADVDNGKLGPYVQTVDTKNVLCQVIQYSIEKYGRGSVSVACNNFLHKNARVL